MSHKEYYWFGILTLISLQDEGVGSDYFRNHMGYLTSEQKYWFTKTSFDRFASWNDCQMKRCVRDSLLFHDSTKIVQKLLKTKQLSCTSWWSSQAASSSIERFRVSQLLQSLAFSGSEIAKKLSLAFGLRAGFPYTPFLSTCQAKNNGQLGFVNYEKS